MPKLDTWKPRPTVPLDLRFPLTVALYRKVDTDSIHSLTSVIETQKAPLAGHPSQLCQELGLEKSRGTNKWKIRSLIITSRSHKVPNLLPRGGSKWCQRVKNQRRRWLMRKCHFYSNKCSRRLVSGVWITYKTAFYQLSNFAKDAFQKDESVFFQKLLFIIFSSLPK